MKKSESIVEISKALSDFQKNVKQPYKDANNPFFKSKYVPLENVVEAITDVAPGLGLSFTQWALNDTNGRVGVATMVLHTSGEFIEYDPVFMNADKNTAQGAGSLISYLKRYSLSAIFGITSDQDDDGNKASGNNQQQNNQQMNNQQSQMATADEMALLHKKTKELAGYYGMDPEKLKSQMGFVNNMDKGFFKQLLTRVNNGITDFQKKQNQQQ